MPFTRLAKGNPNLISIKRAAEMVGLKENTLRYRIDIGNVDPPSTQVGRRFYYSPEQLRTIKKQLQEKE